MCVEQVGCSRHKFLQSILPVSAVAHFFLWDAEPANFALYRLISAPPNAQVGFHSIEFSELPIPALELGSVFVRIRPSPRGYDEFSLISRTVADRLFVPNVCIEMLISPQIMFPSPDSQHEECVYQPFSPSPVSDRIHLNFAELDAFALVSECYQQWGIRFEGAVALQPSNPAFGVEPDTTVLTPEAGRSSIAVYFHQLQKTVGALVTATRQIKLTVFNRDDQPIAEQYVGSAHYLQPLFHNEGRFPQYQMELIADGVARVEFSSDAPFILHDFFCG